MVTNKHRRPQYEPVDYLHQKNERRKMANYLRTGNFRKISGERDISRSGELKRYILHGIALILLLTGLFFIFF